MWALLLREVLSPKLHQKAALDEVLLPQAVWECCMEGETREGWRALVDSFFQALASPIFIVTDGNSNMVCDST